MDLEVIVVTHGVGLDSHNKVSVATLAPRVSPALTVTSGPRKSAKCDGENRHAPQT